MTYDLVTEPSWENAGWLALDIGATLLPFLPGSYAAKGGKAVVELAAGSSKVSKVTGTVKKAAKAVKEAGKKVGSKNKKLGKAISKLGKTNLKKKIKDLGKGAIGGKVPKAACFVAGTLVTAKDGLKPIEKVKAGDFVYSENPETGEKGLKKVVQTFVNETEELIHIHADEQDIVTTPEHPFYVPVKGWTNAADLRAGDILVTVNGEYKVVEKIQHELLESPIQVYNFEVEDFHTYFVGEDSVLVHNACGGKPSSPNRLSKNVAKDVAKKQGYKSVESFKQDFVGNGSISKFDLYVDKKTKVIWLMDKKGNTPINTGIKR